MTVWTALILGLLIGWIVEWVIDWIYWRQRTQNGAAELANLRVQHSRLRADLSAGTGSLAKLKADLAALQTDNQRLQAELQAANSSIGRYQAELGTLNTGLAAAQTDRDRLRAELDALRAPAQATLAAPGAGEQYRTQLLSIDPTLAGNTGGVHLGDGDRQDSTESEHLHADLAGAEGEVERVQTVGDRQRDQLIDINGIGPVYEQRLFDAGIYTFVDLAAQSPARLRELVGAKSWQETDTEAWIAEAQQFIQAGRGRSAQ
jgi:predicted flap endonuclease-1-like 5' DNA nuclease